MAKPSEQNLKKRRDGYKKRTSVNCLPEIFRELVDRDKVELADVQRATGIPFPTLWGFYVGKVATQRLDGSILALAQFFNVSLHYLAFGIGDDTPVFGDISELG